MNDQMEFNAWIEIYSEPELLPEPDPLGVLLRLLDVRDVCEALRLLLLLRLPLFLDPLRFDVALPLRFEWPLWFDATLPLRDREPETIFFCKIVKCLSYLFDWNSPDLLLESLLAESRLPERERFDPSLFDPREKNKIHSTL